MNRGQTDHLSGAWLGKKQSREACAPCAILFFWVVVLAGIATIIYAAYGAF